MSTGRRKLKKTENERRTCSKCGNSLPVTQYYLNHSSLFSSDKIEICKTCVNDYLGDKDSPGHMMRVISLLAIINKPFIYDVWISRDQDWAKYYVPMSSLPQNKQLTFEDSQFTSSIEVKNEMDVNINSDTYTPEQINELIAFWGTGFDTSDYIYLQDEYEKFINHYDSDSYATRLLFQEAAHQRLSIKKKREAKQQVDKELKTLQDLLGSANIKPVQETGANAAEQSTFGTLIKKYENERPIPEPDEAWKDVDGIGKYIKVWFFGHLARMMGVKNELTEDYENEIEQYTVKLNEYSEDEKEDGL